MVGVYSENSKLAEKWIDFLSFYNNYYTFLTMIICNYMGRGQKQKSKTQGRMSPQEMQAEVDLAYIVNDGDIISGVENNENIQ